MKQGIERSLALNFFIKQRNFVLISGIVLFVAFFVQCDISSPTQGQGERKNLNYQSNIYLEYAGKAANWIKSKAVEVTPGVYKWPYAEEGPHYYPVDICTGAAGIGLFFLEIHKVTGNPEYLEYAEGAGEFLSQHDYQEGQIDWLSGAAGIGCYFIELCKITNNVAYLDQAKRAGDWLIGKHYEENGGYYWKHYPDFPKIYTSWAHGAAGIGAFFTQLYDETGDTEYLNYAQGAATWILSYMWEPEPGHYCWPRLTTDTQPNTTWCGGSVGIILFLLKLYDSTGNDSYLDHAQRGTDWLISQARDGGDGSNKWSYGPSSYSYPFAYCHGTPSVVHLLYEMHQRTNNQQYFDFAQRGAKWLQLEAERISDHVYRWPHIKGYPHDTGLLTGTAGVGNSFALYYLFDAEGSYLEYAKGAAHWLISVSEYSTFEQVKWINYVDTYDPDYGEKLHETGWYNGAAGAGLFLLRLSQALPSPSAEYSAPVLNSIGDKEIKVGEKLEFYVSGYDADSDPLIFLAGNLPSGATFTDNLFSWIPDTNQAGTYTVYFIVTDTWGKDWEEVRIKVIKKTKRIKRRR